MTHHDGRPEVVRLDSGWTLGSYGGRSFHIASPRQAQYHLNAKDLEPLIEALETARRLAKEAVDKATKNPPAPAATTWIRPGEHFRA